MKHEFFIQINPITGTAYYQLNQQPLSSKSQLRQCATEHFFHWYQKLPELLYSEINDDYAVKVECLPLEYFLLSAVFHKIPECYGLSFISIKEPYPIEQRYTWLKEVSSTLSFNPSKIPNFSLLEDEISSTPSAFLTTIYQTLPTLWKNQCIFTSSQVNIWVLHQTSGITVDEVLTLSSVTPHDLILYETSATPSIELKKIPVLYLPRQELTEFLIQWINIMVFAPYLVSCQSQLEKLNKSADFFTNAKIQMLTQREPVVQLKIPSRIERQTFVSLDLEEFPLSNLSLKVSDPSVVTQRGNKLYALKDGNIIIDIISSSGVTLQSKKLQVFSVNRVTSITLSSPNGNHILAGDTFSVHASYTPANAVNLSKAIWTASPDGILRHNGNGQFTALKAGICDVRLTVEQVSQELALQVLSLPTDLKLPAEVKLKCNHPPVIFHASFVPSSSACKDILISMQDTSVAQWEPVNKCIIPIKEGTTKLEISVLDTNDHVILKKECPVIVLPEQDIITPSITLSLSLACVLLACLTYPTLFYFIALFFSFFLALSNFCINGKQITKQHASKQPKIEFAISTIIAIATLILIILIFI